MALALLCLLLSACAVEKNHRLLSFFFDGVPDPNAPEKVEEAEQPAIDVANLTSVQRAAMLGRKVGAAEVVVVFHKPVQERDCQGCHQGGGVTGGATFNLVPTLLDQPPGLCWRCHDEPTYEYVHGPAANGSCLICHQPHQSLHKQLLPMPEVELCRTCHTPEVFSTWEQHEAVGSRQCTECHGAHGSDRPSLLLPDVAAELPEPGSEDPPQTVPDDGAEPSSEPADEPVGSALDGGAQQPSPTVDPDHDP